ncbi:MAG: geranylgeranyl reductase family protein [Rhizomicrobium sp.]
MIETYDVIVIGGGPAGASAAYTATTHGLRTCIVDKARFPREKLCGGLLTLRSKKIFERVFGQEWPQNLVSTSSNVFFGLFHGRRVNGPKHSILHFTMRRDFDAYLLGLAETAGTVVTQGVRVVSIDLEACIASLSNGDQLKYRFLIGADGVNSQIAHIIFGQAFDQRTIGFGLEVEVSRQDLSLPKTDEIEIDLAAARWGYGWIFPKARTLTIGVGGIHRLNPDLRDHLRHYLEKSGLNIEKYDVKGQFIPFGDFRAYPARGNVLLCGDAAGFVDPITGEGIAYAMESGSIAAHTIALGIKESWSAGGVAHKYVQELEQITTSLQQANFWRWFIFPMIVQRAFAWAFADASTLQKEYLEILAGNKKYSDLPGLVAFQFMKGLRKLARFVLRSIRN